MEGRPTWSLCVLLEACLLCSALLCFASLSEVVPPCGERDKTVRRWTESRRDGWPVRHTVACPGRQITVLCDRDGQRLRDSPRGSTGRFDGRAAVQRGGLGEAHPVCGAGKSYMFVLDSMDGWNSCHRPSIPPSNYQSTGQVTGAYLIHATE